jgi:hypothetical protein
MKTSDLISRKEKPENGLQVQNLVNFQFPLKVATSELGDWLLIGYALILTHVKKKCTLSGSSTF